MLEIDKKEDIIIPFDNIGDNNWALKTKLIIDSLAENWNKKAKEPISTDDIKKLEERLGTSLPENLKTFYNTFGLSDIGEQLQDFEDIGWIKDIWTDNPYGPDFTEDDKVFLPYLISFSDYLGNGNMFCFHSQTKEIYYYDHDDTPYITKMFDRVDDYIKGCLIFAQYDLFGKADQEQIGKWTEEIVGNLVGKDIAKKWRY